MKYRKMTITKNKLTCSILVLFSAGVLLACGGGGDNPSLPPGNNASPDDTDKAITQQIDARAGGSGAEPDNPANKYTYFNLATNAVVELTDAQADTSGDWHIGFKRFNLKLNSGVSGPSGVKGAVADVQDDFYETADDDEPSPIVSIFSNATPDSERAAFDAVTRADGLSFVEDRNVPYIKGDGTNKGWWLYAPSTRAISANADKWWLIKSAAGDSYAKFNVTNIAQVSRDITLDLYIQGATDSVFSTAVTSWTAAIGGAGGSKCFDIDAATEVDCTTAATDWDVKVEISADGRDWNIWTNGGVSGSGRGGAFGSFDAAGANGYVSGTSGPGGASITRFYRADSAGGLFADNTWYAYNVLNQSPPLLWPNYRVYAIDTGTVQYKLQILSYYDDAGTSGMITFRYASLTETSRVETVAVALTEWAVTPNKTTVNAGPVTFNVTNDGPVDVHEFVIIKTDLAPGSLPVDSEGNVDENGAGITLVGEIENLAVGADAQATFNLEPGNYVLICNIWDAGEQEAHYAEGMRVAFEVQ